MADKPALLEPREDGPNTPAGNVGPCVDLFRRESLVGIARKESEDAFGVRGTAGPEYLYWSLLETVDVDGHSNR